MAKVKVSFNKFHSKYEVYYHHKGKQHISYHHSKVFAEMAMKTAQRVADRL